MHRVIHFEINAKDPKRAVDFYQKVFGWQIDKWDGPQDYWLASTGEETEPGINGAIMSTDENPSTVNTIEVESVADYTDKIKEAGGKVVQKITTIPDIGYFAYCADTEGNIFGVMEPDEKAS